MPPHCSLFARTGPARAAHAASRSTRTSRTSRSGISPLPEIYMPYPIRSAPHLDAARATASTGPEPMGMFDSVPGVEAARDLERAEFRSTGLGLLRGPHQPGRARTRTSICPRDWLTWGTYADDYFPVVFGATHDLAAAKLANDRLTLFMPLTAAPTPEPANPLETGLADLWQRTVEPMTTPGPAGVPRRGHEHDRQLAVGVGKPRREPDPGPDRLRRDATQDLRCGPTMDLARLANFTVVPARSTRTGSCTSW